VRVRGAGWSYGWPAPTDTPSRRPRPERREQPANTPVERAVVADRAQGLSELADVGRVAAGRRCRSGWDEPERARLQHCCAGGDRTCPSVAAARHRDAWGTQGVAGLAVVDRGGLGGPMRGAGGVDVVPAAPAGCTSPAGLRARRAVDGLAGGPWSVHTSHTSHTSHTDGTGAASGRRRCRRGRSTGPCRSVRAVAGRRRHRRSFPCRR
jgi:hypothetical protein